MTDAANRVTSQFAELLVQAGAVNVSTSRRYQFVSGIESPFYVDNRRFIGLVQERRRIVEALSKVASLMNPSVIAGTATAGIPWAAWIAESLALPMCYVRSGTKPRGLNRQIEGIAEAGSRAVLIEDTISTGLSSSSACTALHTAGVGVERCLSIFSFGLTQSISNGNNAVEVVALTTLASVIDALSRSGRYSRQEMELVLEWASSLRGHRFEADAPQMTSAACPSVALTVPDGNEEAPEARGHNGA